MLTVERQGEVAVVTPEVEIATVNAEQVKQELQRLVANGDRRLVVDLTSAGYIDSAALGALLSGLKLARSAGGDLRLCGVAGHPLEILKLTRLVRVFQLHDTRAEAIASFG